jgi:hypothetical protein
VILGSAGGGGGGGEESDVLVTESGEAGGRGI